MTQEEAAEREMAFVELLNATRAAASSGASDAPQADHSWIFKDALSDLLKSNATRPSCQAGLVSRCLCQKCATERARAALTQPAAEAPKVEARVEAETAADVAKDAAPELVRDIKEAIYELGNYPDLIEAIDRLAAMAHVATTLRRLTPQGAPNAE